METENKDPGSEIDRIYDQEKDRRAEESMKETKLMTSPQEVLIKKILKSSKLKDAEYRQLQTILNGQVVSSFDASVFIEYVLGLLKFRRTFLNGKHKAYKKCNYCNSRDNIQRMLHVKSNRKIWVCETCILNLDNSKFVPVKFDEVKEASADLHRKYDYSGLTPAQEDLIHEHREQ